LIDSIDRKKEQLKKKREDEATNKRINTNKAYEQDMQVPASMT